jgi:hypothetical protein
MRKEPKIKEIKPKEDFRSVSLGLIARQFLNKCKELNGHRSVSVTVLYLRDEHIRQSTVINQQNQRIAEQAQLIDAYGQAIERYQDELSKLQEKLCQTT